MSGTCGNVKYQFEQKAFLINILSLQLSRTKDNVEFSPHMTHENVVSLDKQFSFETLKFAFSHAENLF